MNAKLESETYTLPAHWASYLINGDHSGIDGEDIQAADAFLASRDLGSPVSCSDESWFADSNDAGTLAGDVLEFHFLRSVPAFTPGQCAVYTEADGTTRSVTIRSVDRRGTQRRRGELAAYHLARRVQHPFGTAVSRKRVR